MAEEGPRRLRVVYSILDGGVSDVLPYGVQQPGAEGLPPFRDSKNVIYSQGYLKPAWDWTALDASQHVNPTVQQNVASRQETTFTNAQYVVDALFITSGADNQQSYIVLTDGEIFVNGTPCNPVYTYGNATIPGGSYDVSGTNELSLGTASMAWSASFTSFVVA